MINHRLDSRKLSAYWIGDRVVLKKSGRQGTFEGISAGGKARIKVGDKVILTTADNINEIKEVTSKSLNLEEEEKVHHHGFQEFVPEIDLHIEVLDPTLKNQVPQMILSRQVSACRDYIARAISLRRREITIIHGKGMGQLKLEVESLLAGFDEVIDMRSTHDGGATIVFLRY